MTEAIVLDADINCRYGPAMMLEIVAQLIETRFVSSTNNLVERSPVVDFRAASIAGRGINLMRQQQKTGFRIVASPQNEGQIGWKLMIQGVEFLKSLWRREQTPHTHHYFHPFASRRLKPNLKSAVC